MKQLRKRKTILAVALSVCCAVFSTVALTGLNPVKTYAYEQNLGAYANNIVVSDGASATWVKDDAQVGIQKTYSGIKLTGGAGATFDLGTIDISKSFWNGADFTFASTEKRDAGYTYGFNNEINASNRNGTYYNGYSGEFDANNDKFKSFISFVGDPETTTDIGDSSASNPNELQNVKIIVSDEEGNTMNVVVCTGNNRQFVQINAGGGDQNPMLSMRQDQVTPLRDLVQAAQGSMIGKANYPISLVYEQDWDGTNKEDTIENIEAGVNRYPSLYSPNKTANIAGGLYSNWLIRRFDKCTYMKHPYSEAGSYTEGGVDYMRTWNGFTSNLVNVTIEFTTVKSDVESTSLIVTSLGGYDLSNETVTVEGDVKVELDSRMQSTVELVNGSAETTLYAPKYNGMFMNGIPEDFSVEVLRAGLPVGDRISKTAFNENGEYKYTFNKGGLYEFKYILNGVSKVHQIDVQGEIQAIETGALANKFTVSDGASITYGTKKAVQTGVDFTGLVLTGGANSTFKFNNVIDLNNFGWNSSSDYSSFVDFVITPSGNKRLQYNKWTGSTGNRVSTPVDYVSGEMSEVKFTLKEVNSEGVETGNYFVVRYGRSETTEDSKNDPKSMIFAWASVNGSEQQEGAHRYVQNNFPASDRFMTGGTPKATGFTGNATTVTSLAFSDNTVYDNKPYSVTGDSYEIRNFNKQYYAYNNSTKGNPVGGFLHAFENTTFKLEIQFGSFATQETIAGAYYSESGSSNDKGTVQYVYSNGTPVTETSIVLTSLAGLDLTKASVMPNVKDSKVVATEVINEFYYGEDVVANLPALTVSNMLIDLTFDGNYIITKNGSDVILASGEYVANKDISKILKENGAGEYNVRLIDAYGIEKNVKYTVYPKFNINLSDKFTYEINGKPLTENLSDWFTGDLDIAVNVKDGYVFNGILVGDKLIANPSELNVTDFSGNENVITASVTPIKYSITYASAEGEPTFNQQDVNGYTAFTVEDTFKLPIPKVAGKSFLGWYVGDVRFDSASDLELKDYSLVAYFGEEMVAITYVVDGQEVELFYEKGKVTEYVPVKSGYVFKAWMSAKEGGEKVDVTTVTDNAVVYCLWEKQSDTALGNAGEILPTDSTTINNEMLVKPFSLDALSIIAIVFAVLGAGALVAVFVLKRKIK